MTDTSDAVDVYDDASSQRSASSLAKPRASLDAATSDVVDIVDRTPSAELQN